LQGLTRIIYSYKNLFGGGSGSDSKGFESKWGYIVTIDNLANRDATKWEYFFKMNVIEFLNLICYQIDREDNERKL
jgi:hypothetical protein